MDLFSAVALVLCRLKSIISEEKSDAVCCQLEPPLAAAYLSAWKGSVLSCRVEMAQQVWCLSFRQPYAGLVLDGVKTAETRWRPLLAPLENQTLAVHIARSDWEGDEWRSVLRGPLGKSQMEIEALLESGERFGRGVVAGLVDVGKTWQCPTALEGDELQRLECSAVLIGPQEKYVTGLSNPRWLKQPLSMHGQRHLWRVEIPADRLP